MTKKPCIFVINFTLLLYNSTYSTIILVESVVKQNETKQAKIRSVNAAY